MKKTLIALAAALVLAYPATAADGFTRSSTLEQITNWLAAKPTEVYCAADIAAWGAFEQMQGRQPGTTNGMARLGGPDIYLAPWVCADLLVRPRSLRSYAASALTLAHEAQHTRGVRDESEADCAALGYVDNVVWRLGVRWMYQIYRTVQYAWEAHRLKPPEYRRTC